MDDTADTDLPGLIAAADTLIKKIQTQQEELERFYQAENLDPEKLRRTLDDALTSSARARVQAEFQADMEAVEQDVIHEAARLALDRREAAHPADPATIIKMV